MNITHLAAESAINNEMVVANLIRAELTRQNAPQTHGNGSRSVQADRFNHLNQDGSERAINDSSASVNGDKPVDPPQCPECGGVV